MKRVFVLGSINIDLVINAPYMPKSGETVTGGPFFSNPGGKGANQAVASAKLGADTYMIGCVGGEFGDKLKSTLLGYGVNCDGVIKHEDVSSGVAVITVTDGDNRIILDSGANSKVKEEQLDRALSSANKGDYLICQLEIPINTVDYAFKKAKEKEVTTVLNAAPAKELPPSLISNTDIFISNQTEAQFYTGIYPHDEDTARAASDKLSSLGVSLVVITMGTDGSCAIKDGVFTKVECVKADAVDTTAAGDTYVGALVSRMILGENLESSMRFASYASALTVTKKGAQSAIPYLDEVLDFQKNG